MLLLHTEIQTNINKRQLVHTQVCLSDYKLLRNKSVVNPTDELMKLNLSFDLAPRSFSLVFIQKEKQHFRDKTLDRKTLEAVRTFRLQMW